MDQTNCPAHVKLLLTGDEEFRLQEFRLQEPECAFEGVANLSGVARGTANVGEWLRGYEPIIASAQADAARKHSVSSAGDGAPPEWQLTLLAFDQDGYKATFRVGRRRLPESKTFASGLACAAEHERSERQIEKLSCNADLGLRLEGLLAKYGSTWVEYTYTRDYADRGRLVFDVTYCMHLVDEEEVPTW